MINQLSKKHKHTDKKEPQPYKSIIQKMAVMIIVFTFIPLAVINITSHYYFKTSYSDKVLAHIKELSLKHRQNIDNFLNDNLANIRFISTVFTIEQLKDEAFLRRIFDALRDEYGGTFVDLGVVDSSGIQTAYAGVLNLSKADYSDAQWYKELKQRDSFISDVFMGLRQQPHFIVAVKKRRDNEEIIVRATIDFNKFNSLVENIRIGDTGFAFIINRNGEFQTVNRYNIVPNSKTYMDVISKIEHSANDSSAVFNSKISYLGEDYIYAMTSLKDGQWILVCQQAVGDAFSELYRAREVGIFVFIFAAFGVFILTSFLSRKIVAHLTAVDAERQNISSRVMETNKLATLGELAAGIAHEINNPVAIMVEEAGWIGDILEENEFQESDNLAEFKRSLNQIKQQGARCKDITIKLLSFARKTDPRINYRAKS
ncbi:integral membrane sensor signal transduction histidine kinase [Candidatus Magnetoovum chiemensis]|nr:integral membrane sensor signal transduction histidine kinase [Candidatus Magnetoovum chiemensis]